MPLPPALLAFLNAIEDEKTRRVPPTTIFNEGWMLRLILSVAHQENSPLRELLPKTKYWFSEAQLYTPFGRKRGQKLGETNTHADGVRGDFTVTKGTTCGVALDPDAACLEVFEAKMYSRLSNKTTNAPGYDQAARIVACIAQTLCIANRKPDQLQRLRFYVVAPEERIQANVFDAEMNGTSIRRRVAERIGQFTGCARVELDRWATDYFGPVMDRLEAEGPGYLSWEELLAQLNDDDLNRFYRLCKQYNRLAIVRPQGGNRRPVRGREYLISLPEEGTIRVRVCNPGSKSSSVVRSDGQGEVLSRANDVLVEIPDTEQRAAPPDPVVGGQYDYREAPGDNLLVRVVGPGPCRSRVRRVDGIGAEFLAPNHKLFPRALGNEN